MVEAWACMATNGTGLKLVIDDMTADRSSMINSEVYNVYRLCSYSARCYIIDRRMLHSADG